MERARVSTETESQALDRYRDQQAAARHLSPRAEAATQSGRAKRL
jgi:hypothetical protein